jgi:hypothetical protein
VSGRLALRSCDAAGAWGAPLTLAGDLPYLAAGHTGEVYLARVDGDAVTTGVLRAGALGDETRLAVPAGALALDLRCGPAGPVLIWTDSDARVVARVGSASGWTASVPLSLPGARATLCAVATGAGIAAAAWSTDGAIEVAILAEGMWMTEGAVGRGAMPQVAVGRSGEVVVAWVGEGGTTSAAVRDRGGIWGAARHLTGAWHGASGLRLGVGDAGTATLLWTAADATVRMAQRAPAGDWGAPLPLSDPGEPAYFPRIALGPRGALCVWLRVDATVRSAFVPSGADPTPAETLSTAPGLHPCAAVGADGRAVVAWLGEDHSVVARRGDGLAWEEPCQLAAPGAATEPPLAAADSAGGAVVAWSA